MRMPLQIGEYTPIPNVEVLHKLGVLIACEMLICIKC